MDKVVQVHNQNLSIPMEEIEKVVKWIIKEKEQEIAEIIKKINKFEQTKRAQDAFYQSLSPLRKFFTGRPSSQHQAVEYIFHVKERQKAIEAIKRDIHELDEVLKRFGEAEDITGEWLPAIVVDRLQYGETKRGEHNDT